jgi:CDP-diacylglycerol---glycerol-3-phosphate 3-phosphatidyltransferase
MQNLPNVLSLSRLLATVLVFVFVVINQPWAFLLAVLVFLLASATDYFDGYFARRFKAVSNVGIFLDLTADKIFVSAILIAMVQIDLVPGWIVFIIVAREFLVSGLRSIAAARGKVIPAGPLGKQKTFITMIAMGGLMLAKGLGAHQLSLFPPMLVFNSQTLQPGEILLLLSDVLIILATIWTVLSGIEYMLGARMLFQDMSGATGNKQ